ncbi:unnamed protein product, partial [Brassica oleracea]
SSVCVRCVSSFTASYATQIISVVIINLESDYITFTFLFQLQCFNRERP